MNQRDCKLWCKRKNMSLDEWIDHFNLEEFESQCNTHIQALTGLPQKEIFDITRCILISLRDQKGKTFEDAETFRNHPDYPKED